MRPRSLAAVVMLLALASGCGASGSAGGVAGDRIKPLSPPVVSGTVLGLRVGEENVSKTVHGFDHSYADRVSLYSFRRGDNLLEATLQVSRFRDEGRLAKPGFRDSLMTQIGETRPEPLRVGAVTVDVSRGTRQRLSVWTKGRYVFVLSVRDDFARPRDLLRQAVELQP